MSTQFITLDLKTTDEAKFTTTQQLKGCGTFTLNSLPIANATQKSVTLSNIEGKFHTNKLIPPNTEFTITVDNPIFTILKGDAITNGVINLSLPNSKTPDLTLTLSTGKVSDTSVPAGKYAISAGTYTPTFTVTAPIGQQNVPAETGVKTTIPTHQGTAVKVDDALFTKPQSIVQQTKTSQVKIKPLNMKPDTPPARQHPGSTSNPPVTIGSTVPTNYIISPLDINPTIFFNSGGGNTGYAFNITNTFTTDQFFMPIFQLIVYNPGSNNGGNSGPTYAEYYFQSFIGTVTNNTGLTITAGTEYYLSEHPNDVSVLNLNTNVSPIGVTGILYLNGSTSSSSGSTGVSDFVLSITNGYLYIANGITSSSSIPLSGNTSYAAIDYLYAPYNVSCILPTPIPLLPQRYNVNIFIAEGTSPYTAYPNAYPNVQPPSPNSATSSGYGSVAYYRSSITQNLVTDMTIPDLVKLVVTQAKIICTQESENTFCNLAYLLESQLIAIAVNPRHPYINDSAIYEISKVNAEITNITSGTTYTYKVGTTTFPYISIVINVILKNGNINLTVKEE